MKWWIFFIGGIVTGVLLTLLVLFLWGMHSLSSSEEGAESKPESELEVKYLSGVKLLDEPGDEIDEDGFKVFQVVTESAALVTPANSKDLWTQPIYLLTNNDGTMYYDDLKIKVNKGDTVRMIGVYQYETRLGANKTVPVIMIFKD